MAKIYLVRHGETDDNLEKRHQSSSTPLNENGIEQAKMLAEKLKDRNISVIYSSPFDRAMHTSKFIASYHKNIEIRKAHGLRERDFGDFIGLKVEETLKLMPDLEEQRKKQGIDWVAPNGESMRQVQSRIYNCFKEIANNHEKENIVIVSHGGAIIALLAKLVDKPPVNNDYLNKFLIRLPENCEIVEIDWNKEKPELKYE